MPSQQPKTGETVEQGGTYAANGCGCRTITVLSKGAVFPKCPQHGKPTTWEQIPSIMPNEMTNTN